MMDMVYMANLSQLLYESHDYINYESVELRMIFMVILNLAKTDIESESYDLLKFSRMNIVLCNNINFKPRFDSYGH